MFTLNRSRGVASEPVPKSPSTDEARHQLAWLVHRQDRGTMFDGERRPIEASNDLERLEDGQSLFREGLRILLQFRDVLLG